MGVFPLISGARAQASPLLPARAGRGLSLAEHPPRTERGGGHLPERAAVPRV